MLGEVPSFHPSRYDIQSLSFSSHEKLEQQLKEWNLSEKVLAEINAILRPNSSTSPMVYTDQLGALRFTTEGALTVESILRGRAQVLRKSSGNLHLHRYVDSYRDRVRHVSPPIEDPERTLKVNTRVRDLPEAFFKQESEDEKLQKKDDRWKAVKNLDENDVRKILYFRRFAGEFRHKGRLTPALYNLQKRVTNLNYFTPDSTKLELVPEVEPWKCYLNIPLGVKIGVVIGYHHLEKPWGRLFMDMFRAQVSFDEDRLKFIEVENSNIPTGERSLESEKEVNTAIVKDGVTHIIDVHERLDESNHYVDLNYAPEWGEHAGKYVIEFEHTLDPFVPTWMIEQYYEGHIFPQLQQAVNDQIRKVVVLVEKTT